MRKEEWIKVHRFHCDFVPTFGRHEIKHLICDKVYWKEAAQRRKACRKLKRRAFKELVALCLIDDAPVVPLVLFVGGAAGNAQAKTSEGRAVLMLRKMFISAFLIVSIGLADVPEPSAAAEQISSRYSSIDWDECELSQRQTISTKYVCEGFNGWTVVHGDSDAREYLKLRKNGIELGPVPKGASPFNRTGDTLEWRGRIRDGEWRPFALIARWFIDASLGAYNRPDIQVLYVFRFDQEIPLLCTAGYVEVFENPNHNEDARNLAYQIRHTTSCPKGLDQLPRLDRPELCKTATGLRPNCLPSQFFGRDPS